MRQVKKVRRLPRPHKEVLQRNLEGALTKKEIKYAAA